MNKSMKLWHVQMLEEKKRNYFVSIQTNTPLMESQCVVINTLAKLPDTRKVFMLFLSVHISLACILPFGSIHKERHMVIYRNRKKCYSLELKIV